MEKIFSKKLIKNRKFQSFGALALVLLLVFFISFGFERQWFRITGFAVSSVNVTDAPPLKVVLRAPEDDARIFNTSINFEWNDSLDPNYDSVKYHFMLSSNESFSSDAILSNLTGINETPEYTNYTPDIAYSQGDYYWKVRGFDNNSYGEFSDAWKFRYCTDNHNPVIQPIGSFTINEGESFNYTVVAIDVDGDSLIFSDNSPAIEINPSTGFFSFTTPSPGTYIITIVVDDNCNATHDIFILNVIPKEIPPGGGEGGEGGEIGVGEGAGNRTPQPEGGQGVAAGGTAFISKREQKKAAGEENKSEEELTPEERARFVRAEIIYIGNFKEQKIFNVTMYEGPLWFFTYNDKNYFLSLTDLSNESIFIGFFGGPGILFREPSDFLIDLDDDDVSDIRITYENKLGGKSNIVLESMKKPGIELPTLILNAFYKFGLIMLIIFLLILMVIGLIGFMKKNRKRKDPLKVSKRVIKTKDSYSIRIDMANVGDALLENLELIDVIPQSAELDGEVEIEKKTAEDISKELKGNILILKLKSISKKEKFRVSYKIKGNKKPALTKCRINYQTKLFDSYMNFSKTVG